MIFSFFAICYVHMHTRNFFEPGSDDLLTITKLKWYPIIMIICGGFIALTKIYGVITNEYSPYLGFISITISNLEGFLNCCIFGTNA